MMKDIEKEKDVLVSVVIPTLNSAATLDKCLGSIRANDSQYKFEIIIIDGGSKDGTPEIAREYTDKVYQEDTYFRGVNRNKGIRYSKGDIICFTDSDCAVPENWIDTLVESLFRLNNKDNRIAGVGGGNIPWIDNPTLIESSIITTMRSPLVAFGARNVSLYREEREVSHNPPMNSAYFKNVLEESGGFGEEINVGEDVELDIRITGNGYKLYYLPDMVILHKHRTTIKKFIRQMYEFGKARVRLGQKYKHFRKNTHLGALYHYGPLFLCLMVFSPFLFIPWGMALVNSLYCSIKEKKTLLFFSVLILTIGFYVSYGAGELSALTGLDKK